MVTLALKVNSSSEGSVGSTPGRRTKVFAVAASVTGGAVTKAWVVQAGVAESAITIVFGDSDTGKLSNVGAPYTPLVTAGVTELVVQLGPSAPVPVTVTFTEMTSSDGSSGKTPGLRVGVLVDAKTAQSVAVALSWTAMSKSELPTA